VCGGNWRGKYGFEFEKYGLTQGRGESDTGVGGAEKTSKFLGRKGGPLEVRTSGWTEGVVRFWGEGGLTNPRSSDEIASLVKKFPNGTF